jgi:hypothetical protein
MQHCRTYSLCTAYTNFKIYVNVSSYVCAMFGRHILQTRYIGRLCLTEGPFSKQGVNNMSFSCHIASVNGYFYNKIITIFGYQSGLSGTDGAVPIDKAIPNTTTGLFSDTSPKYPSHTEQCPIDKVQITCSEQFQLFFTMLMKPYMYLLYMYIHYPITHVVL